MNSKKRIRYFVKAAVITKNTLVKTSSHWFYRGGSKSPYQKEIPQQITFCKTTTDLTNKL